MEIFLTMEQKVNFPTLIILLLDTTIFQMILTKRVTDIIFTTLQRPRSTKEKGTQKVSIREFSEWSTPQGILCIKSMGVLNYRDKVHMVCSNTM